MMHTLAAAARLGENTATIIDLKSGNPRLIIDAGIQINGLGVTANTVTVVGEEKVITWDLPAGDCVFDARANIHDSVWAVVFDRPHLAPPSGQLYRASISPNFSYVITTRGLDCKSLDVHDVSTGKHLVDTATVNGRIPWFTRDGREIRSSYFYLEG